MIALRTLTYIVKAMQSKSKAPSARERDDHGHQDPVAIQTPPEDVPQRRAELALEQPPGEVIIVEAAPIDVIPAGEPVVPELHQSKEESVIELLHREEDAVIDLLGSEMELLQTQLAETRAGASAHDTPDSGNLLREIDVLHTQLARAIQQLGWERERAEILNREALARMERRGAPAEDALGPLDQDQKAQQRREHDQLQQAKKEQERLERLARLEQRFCALSKDVIVELSLERKSFVRRMLRR